MLSDWYFCISLQLPLQQAVSHLQTLSTLREALAGDDLVPDEILADVTGMGAASGQWHLLHALAPVLAMRQSRRAQPVAQAVSRYCESVVDACVADERTAKELRGLLQAAVKGGVGGNSSLAQGVAELADRVLAAPPSTSPSSVPYFDLVDFAVPVIILSLLDMVSRRVPGAVRDVVAGADRAAWFARALEGGYGRHAMLLSVATAGRAGDQHAVRFLARPEAGVVDMEPDLLACFARSRFQRDGEPAAQLMAEYEIEAVTCRSLPAPVWHDGLPSAREIISQRLCGQPRMSRALAAVLWHVIMWELAAECDPADCAVRLRRWWGAPGDRGEHPFRKRANFRLTLPGGGERGTIRPINGLCDLRANELRLTVEQRADWQRSPRGQGAHGSARPPLFAGKPQVADGDVSQTSPNDGAAVFSPWAYRKSWHKTWDKVKPADYASRTAFPGLVDPVSMIRLLAGAALAVRVLRALPAEAGTQPHLLSLMLHAKDVVADCRFKPVRGAGDHGSEPDPHEVALMEVPQPVHGLILCVDRILDQAGMGSYARIDPASLARFILDRAYGQVPDGESPPAAQIRNLYRQAAPGFAVQWIKEVLSGYAPERGQQDGPGPDGGARWFAAPESGDPPALQILAQSIENEHSGGPRQAASLLLQLAPDQFAQFQRLQAGWDWYARRQEMQDADEASKGDGQARRPFTISTLVCAPPYSLEQWQIATPLLERWLPADDTGSRAPVYTTMLAARVEALLRDPAGSAGSFDQWVQAYLDRLRAMVSVKELPRELRGVMIDWIPWEDPRSVPLPVHNPPGRTLLADVLAASIDTIVQFSKRTPRYQVLLMDRLQETILPEGIANEFRHQLVRAVLQAREVTDERSMRTGPTERLLEHQNARRLGGALSRFLLNLASRPLPQLGATLGDAFLALWHDLNRDPAIQAVTLPLGGQAGSADGAGTWNLATVLDRYRDIKVIYPMPIDVTRASIRGSKDESVESFFAAPLSRRRDTLALGIVCGIEPDQGRPRSNVQLNVGLGEPVAVAVDAWETPAVGELRAVNLSWTQDTARWEARSIHELAAALPRAGERRPAVVSAIQKFPWLRVRVDDRDVYKADDDRDAAAIRMAWDPDITRGLTGRGLPCSAGNVTLARFDEDCHGWIPVDRGLTEFLGTQVTDAPVEMTYGGREEDERAHVRWRLTASPGFSYLLSAADWTDPGMVRQTFAGDPVGLVVQVGLDRASGLLTLLPDADGRYGDDRNVRWSALFAESAELTAVQHGEDWVAEVESPPGLPDRIPVTGLAAGDTLFEVSRWTDYDQRRGQIQGSALTSYYLADWDNPTRDRLRELRNINEDDYVRLGRLIRFNPEGLSTASTQDGLTLSVETSSLSLLGLRKDHAWQVPVDGRRARVYSVSDRPGALQQAVPFAGLAEALAHSVGESAVLSDGITVMEGALVRRLRSRRAGSPSPYWGLWLETGSEFRYCEVPSSAFEILPLSSGLGDLVTARRTEGGWVFRAQCRSIRVRATFRVVEGAAIPPGRRRTVGYEVDGWEVVQDSRGAVLACIRPQARSRGAFEDRLAMAALSTVGEPFGRNRRWQRAVALFEDGTVTAGLTEPYDAAGQVASVRDVRIEFTTVPGSGGAETEIDQKFVYDLHPRAIAEDVSEAEVEYFRRLEQSRQRIVLTGILDRGGIRFGTAVRLPDGRYSRTVPRVPDDGPWIALDEEDRYDESVRAVLIPDGSGYRASCRQAPPLPLQEFQSVLGTSALGSSAQYATPAHFRYVGLNADGDGEACHSFEWGHGWTVRVPDSRLYRPEVAGRPLRLFHGDRIVAVTLFRHKGEISMRFDPGAVRLGLPGRVYQEARTSMVHQLRVEIDPGRGTVQVRSVLTGRRDLSSRRQNQANPVSVRARLTKKSVERLLAAVSPESGHAPVIRDVLARLDRELFKDLERGQGRRLEFVYIPAKPGDGASGLGRKDRVFLLPGRIRRTVNGNDTLMEFTSPGDAGVHGPGLRVEVARRDYSYRQDVLPRMLEAQEADRPAQSQLMAVTLMDPPADRKQPWRGVTKWPPSRSASQLRTFLATFKERSCLAVVGEDEGQRPGLEVEPGVVYQAKGINLPVSAEPGAVVRLTLLASGNDVVAELAVPSDLSYLPEGPEGRPAIVMPKTPLLRQDPHTLLASGRHARDYTIAGLPGIEARAASSLSAQLMTRPHPKTALLRRKGAQVDIAEFGEVAELRDIAELRQAAAAAGSLEVNPQAEAAVIVPFTTAVAPGIKVDWAQLSFADSDIERIARACQRSSFRYSDALTGHWAAETDESAPGQARFVPARLRGRGSAAAVGRADEIVLASFPDGLPTLRHAGEDLRRFGFPVTHLLELLATAVAAQEREFTVAGVACDTHGSRAARGLWLEIRPGHLVELTGSMLTDTDGHPVGRLNWEHFAPGDRVTLGLDTADPGSLALIRLERWRPGPRAGFALRQQGERVLLPVAAASASSGSLTLGAGRCRVSYPASAAVRSAFPSGTAAWLTAGNHLWSAGPLRAGDAVLLGSGGGGLLVHGMADVVVELADTGWPDGWIRDALADASQREVLLDLVGKALPVTVEAVPSHDRVIVSRRRQPAGVLPADSLLWGRFRGPIRVGGECRLVFDAGGAFFAVRSEELVPGIPPQTGDGAGVRDARAWLYADENGRLRGGQHATAERSGEVLVIVERALESGGDDGLICREKETSAYRWLPSEHASWCGASAADLAPHLRGRELRVAVQDDGSVSLIGAAAAQAMFTGLALGATHRIEYLAPGGPAGTGLARIHLSEAIVAIGKLGRRQHAQGGSLLGEVAQVRSGAHPYVLMVPQGRRRIVVDLPPSIVQAMRQLSGWLPAYHGPIDIPELERFLRYRETAAGGVAQNGQSAAEAVIVAAKHACATGTLPLGTEVTRHAAEWAVAHEGAEEIDLAPALGACIVLDTHGRIAGDAESAQAAVAYLHLVGLSAQRSMHVEALVSRWLGQPDRWQLPGDWERLRRVLALADAPEDGTGPDPRELDDDGGPIRDFARSILERADPREPLSDPSPTQHQLAPVARGLLAAIGLLSTGEHWTRDATILADVAGLGRGLTPAVGRRAAQRSLLGCQRQLLEGLFLQVARSGQPYVLLPQVRT